MIRGHISISRPTQRAPEPPAKYAGAGVVAAKRAARRDGVRVLELLRGVKLVPSKRRCLVPPTSGSRSPLGGCGSRTLQTRFSSK